MGFPSLVYTFGWVGRALDRLVHGRPADGPRASWGSGSASSRGKTGAITLPDLFRERFGSPTLGMLTSLLVMFFLICNLVAQFTAGARIMKIVLPARPSGWFVERRRRRRPSTRPTSSAWPIFTATVVAYTTYGGFLAAIWTDVFQSIIMAVGVLLLLPAGDAGVGGAGAATLCGHGPDRRRFAFGPGAGRAFHPIGLAFSFFFMWAITGMGQPSTLVRLMAFRDSRTLRYSIIYLTIYNAVIYIPLIFIFVAARSILPEPRVVRRRDAQPGDQAGQPLRRGPDPGRSLWRGAEHGQRLAPDRLVGPGARPLPAVPPARRASRARDRLGELLGDGRRRGVVAAPGPQSAGLSPAHHRLLQRGDGLGVPDARDARLLLAAGDGRRARSRRWRAGPATTWGSTCSGTRPERLGLAWLFGPNPTIGIPPAEFRPYYLFGLDPCVWGLSASLARGRARQPGALRPPDPRTGGATCSTRNHPTPAPISS